MFRKSILASAVFVALLPSAAVALGVGSLRTQSALNEPFTGQVDLLDVRPDELDTVKVSLAADEEFRKAGTERPHFLTTLRFRPHVSSRGRAVILITGTEPVREPFLDFLIEVNWPKGRLVKEYTVLLDPPVTLNRPPPRSSLAAMGRAPSSLDPSAFPMRHGPVASGSNLWRIARRMAPATRASVAQTAMALYRNNQEAFIRGDINRLRVHTVLEIPTAAELFALDSRSADQEFRAAVRGKPVTTTPITDITGTPESEAWLEIASKDETFPTAQPRMPAPPAASPAQVPPATAPVAPQTPSGVTPFEQPPGQDAAQVAEGVTARETAPELGGIKKDLLLVQEVGESTRQETEELRGRIRELEGQLADIQRLLELRNEQFAALQQTQSEQLAVAEAEATDTPPPEIEDEEVSPETEGPEVTATEDRPETVAVTPPEDITPRTELQPSSEEAADAAAATAPPAEPERPFWASISPALLSFAVGGPLLLLLMGWMVRRRRKSLEESLPPVDLMAQTPAPSAAADTDPETAAFSATGPASEISSASGDSFSPHSAFGSLEDEPEEADIISEADVYIAYGRYREAESLLEGEIERSPDRMDIRFKLAEAYYGAKNLEGMESLMSQMERAGAEHVDPDQWQRLSAMLEDFKGTTTDSLRPTTGRKEDPALASVEPIRRHEATTPQDLSPETDLTTLDFLDTQDIRADTPPRDHAPDQRTRDSQPEVDELELLGGGRASPETEETVDLSGGTSDLELQLEDLDDLEGTSLDSLSTAATPAKPVTEDGLSEGLEDSKFASLDLGADSKFSLGNDLPMTQWQTDSAMWDEVATKLDLARAYMEMEDPGAAQVILEEVAEEGTEDQRALAKEMMAQLS